MLDKGDYNKHRILKEENHPSHEKYAKIFSGYDHEHFRNIEPLNDVESKRTADILKRFGETKSAAKWIDSVYKEMDEPISVSEERVARILAARQLGNAVYGDPKNIKNAKFSEAELRVHADKLMQSQAFKDYYKSVVKDLDFKKTIKHGHGGYLEKTFEDFLVEEKKAAGNGELDKEQGPVVKPANQ